jgi:hypothetical protein
MVGDDFAALADIAKIAQPEAATPFVQSLMQGLFARFTQWFADASNGIADFFAKRVRTQELCVDDICVTREKFAEVFGNQSAAAGTLVGGGPSRVPSGLPALGDGVADAATTTASTVPASSTSDLLSPLSPSTNNPSADDAVIEKAPPPNGPAPTSEPAAANDNQPAEQVPATGTQD